MRTFSDVNTLQEVHIEVVGATRPQRIATEIATNSAARQVTYVHGSTAVNTCAAGIWVGEKGCTDRHRARIVRRCGDGWDGANAFLSCWVEGGPIQVSPKLIGISTVDDREGYPALKGGHTGEFPATQQMSEGTSLLL